MTGTGLTGTGLTGTGLTGTGFAGTEAAAHTPPGHARAHQAERPQVIAGQPGDLVHPAQRRRPGPQPQLAPAPVADRAQRVVVLDQEAAVPGHLARRHRLPGEIEIRGPDDIETGAGGEQPELRPEPRVEIQQLVLGVPRVEAQVEIEDPAEADGGRHRGDLLPQPAVRHRPAQAGQPGVGGVGAVLDPGERGLATAGRVEVPVEEPVLSRGRRDVLLQHQPGARLVSTRTYLLQFRRRPDDRGAPQPRARGPPPGGGELGDERESRLPRERRGLAG